MRSCCCSNNSHVPLHLEGLLAVEIGRQAGRDLATEAPEAHEALQLGVVGHCCPPIAHFGKFGLPRGFLLWRSRAHQKFSMPVAVRQRPTADGSSLRTDGQTVPISKLVQTNYPPGLRPCLATSAIAVDWMILFPAGAVGRRWAAFPDEARAPRSFALRAGEALRNPVCGFDARRWIHALGSKALDVDQAHHLGVRVLFRSPGGVRLDGLVFVAECKV
jgi:hypothetical protein